MDIDRCINELICKYDIDKHNLEFRFFIHAKSLIEQFYLDLLKQYETIILVGFQKTPVTWFQKNICCNNANECVVYDLNDLSDDTIVKNSKTFYLVVSYEYKDELKARIYDITSNVENIYEIFEDKKMFFKQDFYDIYGMVYHNFRTGMDTKDFACFDINEIFFLHRRNYELEKDKNRRKVYLEQMIFDCVYSRDFLLLKEYIEIHYEEYEDEIYLKFYNETEDLLRQISLLLRKRNQKDCLMIWMDALEYGEDNSMSFLHSLNGKALVFDNMYTVTPYTGATFKTLFGKMRVIEEESFKVSRIGENNSELINGLKSRGYTFRYYGELELLEQKNVPYYFYSIYTVMTLIFWNILRDLVLQKECEKGFFVLHEVLHTHSPYISLGLKGETYTNLAEWAGRQEEAEQVMRNRQAMESRKYVDRQLAFWDKILPECMYKIYMSDHGHTRLGRFHTIMKICQQDICARHCESLLSYYEFDRVMLHILDYNDIDDQVFNSKYIIVQDVDYYYKDHILDIIKFDSFSEDDYIGYQGVITKKDMLISHRHGVEYYQKKENDGIYVTDSRLNYLRTMLSKSQIDIFKERKFKYSRIIWTACKKCTVRTSEFEDKKRKIIQKIFDNIPTEKVVSIRGGIHTLRLLMLLDNNQAQRVAFIIDRNSECVAGKMGIRVIQPEDLSKEKPDYIIVSSYDNGKLWKEELVKGKYNHTVTILDIYEELEKEHIICKKEFYKKDYIDQDFYYLHDEINIHESQGDLVLIDKEILQDEEKINV